MTTPVSSSSETTYVKMTMDLLKLIALVKSKDLIGYQLALCSSTIFKCVTVRHFCKSEFNDDIQCTCRCRSESAEFLFAIL